MPQMTYFRRAALAGKSLKRNSSAQLRGNIRRNDIDLNSAEPYFPNITNGQTLVVEGINGSGAVAQATVGIPASVGNNASITTLIAALNTGLASVNVQAFDDGGCVGLRSLLSASAGRVRVIGGTAAKALGFDVSAQSFFALASDIPSSIEGRGLGQPYGTALATIGENLTSDAFTRALGRVMSNTDVLYSDLMRREIMPTKVGTVSAAAGALSFLDLGPQKVFVRLTSPSKEDLAHLFFLVDQATKQISQCRVTGITNSSNVSILNQDQSVVASTGITGIANGRVVTCPSGNFTGAGVQEGDFATISGAGNLTPFSNNGYRWVVEEVLDATHVALRPMSLVEQSYVGSAVDENQPLVELNSAATGAWGSLSISRGPFSTNARLQISPPIPRGASYDVWAATGNSLRERPLTAPADRGVGIFSTLTHDYDTAPNGLLTRPSMAQTATTLAIGPFMARWHNRPIRVPGQTFTPGAGAATWFIYWDEIDAQLKASTNPALVFVTEAREGASANELNGITPTTAGKGQLIATVVTNIGGTIILTSAAARVISDDTTSYSVGHGGQFRYLEQGLEYVRQLVASGQTRHQTEFLVISDQTAPVNGWNLPGAPISIRGGTPRIHLNHAVTGALFNSTASDVLLLSEVTFDFSKVFITGTGAWTVKSVTSSTDNSRRSEDSSQRLDLGATAPGVDLGRSGVTHNVRGNLAVAEGVNVPPNRAFTVGVSGNAAQVRLDTDGTQGRVVFGKVGEAEVPLTKDQIDLLVGGAVSDAQTLHTHGDINTAISGLNSTVISEQTQINNKSDINHLHDGRYALIGHTHDYSALQQANLDYVDRFKPGLSNRIVVRDSTSIAGEGNGRIYFGNGYRTPVPQGLANDGSPVTGFWLDLQIITNNIGCVWITFVDGIPIYYTGTRWQWNGIPLTSYATSAQWHGVGYTIEQHVLPFTNTGFSNEPQPALAALTAGQWTGAARTDQEATQKVTTYNGSEAYSDQGLTLSRVYTGLNSSGWQSFFIPGNVSRNVRVWAGVMHTNDSSAQGIVSVEIGAWVNLLGSGLL